MFSSASEEGEEEEEEEEGEEAEEAEEGEEAEEAEEGEEEGEGSLSEDNEAPTDNKRIKTYNPEAFNLNVSQEIKDLFQYISAYKPQQLELPTKLKPFIPDYIPAVGDLDPFIKIPRPDKKDDLIGLKSLDEPAARQSDPHVIQLQLSYEATNIDADNNSAASASSYESTAASKKASVIKTIENASKNKQKILKWIEDIKEIHKKNPPPTVHYSKPQADIDSLMQVWPEQFEELLQQNISLPSADMDLSLEEYARVICALLDIPVYDNLVESLHVLFTLFNEFNQNQHFSAQLQK